MGQGWLWKRGTERGKMDFPLEGAKSKAGWMHWLRTEARRRALNGKDSTALGSSLISSLLPGPLVLRDWQALKSNLFCPKKPPSSCLGKLCAPFLGSWSVCSAVSDSLWPCGLQPTRLFYLSCWISQQEYWSVLPFPSLGDLPDPGIESASSVLWVLYHWATF